MRNEFAIFLFLYFVGCRLQGKDFWIIGFPRRSDRHLLLHLLLHFLLHLLPHLLINLHLHILLHLADLKQILE